MASTAKNADNRTLFNPQNSTLDKEGKEISSVGFTRFGFDCEVPLSALRALYLRPHYVNTNRPKPTADGKADVEQEIVKVDDENDWFTGGDADMYQ